MKGFCLGLYRFGVIANVSMFVLIALAILIKQPATATPGAVFAAVAIVTACTLLPGIILSFVFTGKTPWQLMGKTPFLFRWAKLSERYAKGSEPWLSRAGHDAPDPVKTVHRQQKRLAERRGNKDMWRFLRRERLEGHRFQRMLKINRRRLARSAEP